MARGGDANGIDKSFTSPGGSDVGSSTSSTVPASSQQGSEPFVGVRSQRSAQAGIDRKESVSSGTSSRRIGSLQGAGLSSLNLALGGTDAGYAAGPSLAGFNAISTLLNDPRKPQRPIDPSSSRYPAISQSTTELPKVKRSDYDGTINNIRAEWARYIHSTSLGIKGKAKFDGREATYEAGLENGADEEASLRALGNKRLPPLSTVPQVFFSEEFDMGNPYTFDLVTERYKATATTTASDGQNGSAFGAYDVALNQMLQEKMSYYSDVVEQHLILEISARSSSFFAALGNLQDLEEESRTCLDKVEELKKELSERDEDIAKAGLGIISEQAKRRRLAERLEAVGLLHQLCEKRDLCHLLIQNSELSEALDVLANLASLLAGTERLESREEEPTALQPHVDLDLASIPAIQAMAPQLNEMRQSIASQLEAEVLDIMTADISSRTEPPEILAASERASQLPLNLQKADAESGQDRMERDSPALPDRLSESEQILADRLQGHLTGLIRTNSVDRAMSGYKETLLKGVRSTMRSLLLDNRHFKPEDRHWLRDLASLLDDDDTASGRIDAKLGPGGAEAASQLRSLPLADFLSLLRTLLTGLLRFTEAADAQRKVLIKVLDDRGRRLVSEENDEGRLELVMPPGVSPSLPSNLSANVADACSQSHVLASRLLSLRSGAHISLDLKQFLAIFHTAWAFVLESEAICGRMIIGLRGVVLNQAKAWLSTFHRQRIEKAAKAVEEEQWSPTDVSQNSQRRVSQIVDSATADPQAFLIGSIEGEGNDAASLEAEDEPDASRTKTLLIDDKQFWVVPASLDVLALLVDYLCVVISLPLLTTEIMSRVVEFLKQFNSRTCQVVLGAGAMRSAGLKNITARHLALASQSLSVMITLVPYIREAVRRHLNPRQAVMLVEFDKLKRDYQEHQYEIHSKLIAIMGDRLTVHCRALSNLDWAAPLKEEDAVGQGGENTRDLTIKPIADLIRETTVLHKRLCTYLQPPVVETIIGQVLVSTDERVSSEIRKIEGHDENMKRRVSGIMEAFDRSYEGLRYVTWSNKAIKESVEEIQKREPPPPPPLPPANATPAHAHSEAEKVRSPTLPQAYKPRLNIFARRNQQNQVSAGSPVLDGRPSTDSQAPRPEDVVRDSSIGSAPPFETGLGNRSSPSVETPPIAPKGDDLKEPEGAVASPSVEKEAPLAMPSPLSETKVDLPPPTPEKDHRGHEFVPPTSGQQGEGSPEKVVSPPTTPAKTVTELPRAKEAMIAAIKSTEKQEKPRTAATRSSAPPTSGTPVRMTLQQRLAEAARKRAQANASSSTDISRPETPSQAQSVDSPTEKIGVPSSAPPFATSTPIAVEHGERIEAQTTDDGGKEQATAQQQEDASEAAENNDESAESAIKLNAVSAISHIEPTAHGSPKVDALTPKSDEIAGQRRDDEAQVAAASAGIADGGRVGSTSPTRNLSKMEAEQIHLDSGETAPTRADVVQDDADSSSAKSAAAGVLQGASVVKEPASIEAMIPVGNIALIPVGNIASTPHPGAESQVPAPSDMATADASTTEGTIIDAVPVAGTSVELAAVEPTSVQDAASHVPADPEDEERGDAVADAVNDDGDADADTGGDQPSVDSSLPDSAEGKKSKSAAKRARQKAKKRAQASKS